jgi:hypothetical protein
MQKKSIQDTVPTAEEAGNSRELQDTCSAEAALDQGPEKTCAFIKGWKRFIIT